MTERSLAQSSLTSFLCALSLPTTTHAGDKPKRGKYRWGYQQVAGLMKGAPPEEVQRLAGDPGGFMGPLSFIHYFQHQQDKDGDLAARAVEYFLPALLVQLPGAPIRIRRVLNGACGHTFPPVRHAICAAISGLQAAAVRSMDIIDVRQLVPGLVPEEEREQRGGFVVGDMEKPADIKGALAAAATAGGGGGRALVVLHNGFVSATLERRTRRAEALAEDGVLAEGDMVAVLQREDETHTWTGLINLHALLATNAFRLISCRTGQQLEGVPYTVALLVHSKGGNTGGEQLPAIPPKAWQKADARGAEFGILYKLVPSDDGLYIGSSVTAGTTPDQQGHTRRGKHVSEAKAGTHGSPKAAERVIKQAHRCWALGREVVVRAAVHGGHGRGGGQLPGRLP